jgi:hypothetical protein
MKKILLTGLLVSLLVTPAFGFGEKVCGMDCTLFEMKMNDAEIYTSRLQRKVSELEGKVKDLEDKLGSLSPGNVHLMTYQEQHVEMQKENRGGVNTNYSLILLLHNRILVLECELEWEKTGVKPKYLDFYRDQVKKFEKIWGKDLPK